MKDIKQNPPVISTGGLCHFSVRHQVGRSLWAFTHCSVFNFRRRSGSLRRTLAPHQAKPGLLSGGVSSIISWTSCYGFRLPGKRIGVSRDTPGCPWNPVSTGSIAI